MRHLSSFIVFVLLGCLTNAQVPSTMGRDFWVAFLPNGSDSLSLWVSGNVETTGQVSTTTGNWTQTFTVSPGQMTGISIPRRYAISHDEDDMEQVLDLGLHVTTRAAVSLYASNYANASFDNTNVLPTDGLRRHYLIQTTGATVKNNEFCVLAVQDSTWVYIKMSANSSGGNFVAGRTDSVLMNSGQTLLVQSASDLSGTEIWTERCKSLAVFVGNICAYVPSNCGACDHLYEQAVPTEFWGTHFGIVATKTRTFDIIKITALENNTRVRCNNRVMFDLQARQSEVIELNSLNGDTALYLRTTKPVSVSQYLTGISCGGSHGDPSVMVVHPIEEQMSHVTFATYSTSLIDCHFVNIVTRSIYASDIYMDSQQVNPQVFRQLPGNSDYVYAQIQVEHGVHSLTSTGGGFVAQVYGLGRAESYAYVAGSSLDPINPYAFLNGIPFFMYDSTNNVFCMYDTCIFTSEVLKGNFTTVIWDFGDGTVEQGSSVRHTYSQPGSYTVRVQFGYVDECMKITKYTLSMPLVIAPQRYSETDTAVCDSVCVWNGRTFDTTGTYNVLIPVGEICDSLARLNIVRMYGPSQPMIEKEYDCSTHRYDLHAIGEGNYIRWSCSPENAEIEGFEHDSVISITPDTARNYFLYMAWGSDSSCGAETSILVPKLLPLEARPSADRNVVDYERPVVVLMDKSVDAVGRTWYADGVEIGTSSRISYSLPLNVDSVVIILVVYDNIGCSDTDYMTIYIVRAGIYVPNIFTPGLSENGFFSVHGEGLLDGEIWIYNRGGQLVWYTDNIFDRWDGTKEGKELPSGSYVYTIHYHSSLEPKISVRKTGTVTMVR